MKFQRKKRDKVDITLISMIDVLFVLLLFFMVSTTFNRHTGIKIILPEASTADTEDAPKNITVDIDAKGNYCVTGVDGRTQKLQDQHRETLVKVFWQFADQPKTMPFIINADENSPHKAVVTVLDVAREMGFTHATFPTKTSKIEE